jgi:hypothetical protein
MKVGHSHHRYYVRDVVVDILQSIKSEAEALLARDVLRSDCHAISMRTVAKFAMALVSR